MERRPLIVENGRLRELPIGDTLAGLGSGSSQTGWREPISVYNNGIPEVVFAGDGEIIMTDSAANNGVLVNPDVSEIVAGLTPLINSVAQGAVTTELGSFVDVVAAYNLSQ